MAHELPPSKTCEYDESDIRIIEIDGREFVGFRTQAQAILYELLVYRDMNSKAAIATVKLWQRGNLAIAWDLEARTVAIYTTPEGMQSLMMSDMMDMPSIAIN